MAMQTKAMVTGQTVPTGQNAAASNCGCPTTGVNNATGFATVPHRRSTTSNAATMSDDTANIRTTNANRATANLHNTFTSNAHLEWNANPGFFLKQKTIARLIMNNHPGKK
jgi:hypothetical protein